MITLLVPALYLLAGVLVVGLAERLERLMSRPLPPLGPMRGIQTKLFAAMVWPLFGLATLQDLAYLGWCYLYCSCRSLAALLRRREPSQVAVLPADSSPLCSGEPADFPEAP